MRLDRAEELVTGLIEGLSGTAGVISMEPAGSFRRRKESIGDLDILAETDQPAALVDAFTTFGMVDSVINKGGYKAAVRTPARAAGGPDDHAAGRGRDLPDPLHGLQGAQRQAPRHGPRPGLEPVREGFPAHRRGRRAADRRRRGAADLRHRDRRLRLPRPALHRARAARGHRRDRGGARRPAAGARSSWPTCAATCTATPTGPTATSRSRS